MKKLLVLALCLAAARANAQPAAALGHPLPAGDLDRGTISVKVIAGTPKNPVSGTDVTLIVNGTPRSARTDEDGRAYFKDLPSGVKVQAKIVDEDKKEVASDEFEVPAEGGARVMLTTRPMAGGMGGAPFAGGGGAGGPTGAMGAGGMPEPRQLSGQPRPEQADPPGLYTVRLTYDDLKEQPPAGLPVVLVGYVSDDSITVQVAKTDADGRVQFKNLDRSGATSYFAMANMPRGATTDRLLAQPVVMPPQVGVRVLLSSQKKDSTAPAIDDLGAAGEDATPAGKVRVSLDGVPEPSAEVALVDAQSHTVLAKVHQTPGPPDPRAISGGAPFEQRTDLPAGTLTIDAHGGMGTATGPLEHVAVRVIPGDAQDIPEDAPGAETDASGNARLDKIAGGAKKAVLTINGRQFLTNNFDLAGAGGALHVTAQWESTGKPEAVFDYIPRADQVVYAETIMRGQQYRSRPFMGVSEHGSHLVLQIYPRVLFAFSWTARIDDEFLNVQGRFEVFNNSWAPYAQGKDGILVPLPKGFQHGILAEQDQMDVAADPGNGFRIVRPIPPGGRRFIGGFSLPVEAGKVDWKLDLPFGAYQSGIEIQDVDGMSIQVPAGVQAEHAEDKRGKWQVLSPITIMP
ncbi:MAG: carboxypeptidase regulatory-like domain-containing protein, partial [Candidatus Eremiobacteraeota bacterium]|nr:carboxypeptidase regulatory-like domain-containing protein [Candidatus Eremiobacteraeota bacterium]